MATTHKPRDGWALFWRRFDQARVVPRGCLIAYGWMTWHVTQWFMALPNPTSAQGMFGSVVFGAIPFLLNFYMQNGVQWSPPPRPFLPPGAGSRPDFVDDR